MAETMEDTVTRQQWLLRLYQEAFPAVARYVAQTGGSFEEARDIFQDALVAWYEKTKEDHFVPEQSEKAYLIGIARNIWHKKLERHNSRFTSDKGLEKLKDHDQPEISATRLLRFLEHSGKKCMALLQAVYYEKTPMKNIAQQFGFSGERSATVQKHKCLEKVRDSIKEKSLAYEDFYE